VRRLSADDAEAGADPDRPHAAGGNRIDLTGKKAGRGAYLCGQAGCFKLAKKTKAFERALKVPVEPAIYDRLEADFIRVEDEFAAGRERSDDDDDG